MDKEPHFVTIVMILLASIALFAIGGLIILAKKAMEYADKLLVDVRSKTETVKPARRDKIATPIKNGDGISCGECKSAITSQPVETRILDEKTALVYRCGHCETEC